MLMNFTTNTGLTEDQIIEFYGCRLGIFRIIISHLQVLFETAEEHPVPRLF